MGFMFYVWIMVMVVAVIVEIATTDLTSFWFAIGAFASLISNLFLKDTLIYVQVIVFAVVSIVAIFTLRPLLKKRMETSTIATNADALIGQHVLVLEKIEPNHPGVVKAEGTEWTAKSETDTFEQGDFVEITDIVGNTLVVKKYIERGKE